MQLLIFHIRKQFISFPINAQLIFTAIFDRLAGEGLLQVDRTDAQQFSIKVNMHHRRDEAYRCSKQSLEACHIGFSQHSTILYLMNNLWGLCVSDHIGSMDHHIELIQKRCRVCGNMLVPRGKRKRTFYQCYEFAAQLFSVFSVDISNDVPGTHPSFCYSCKQVLERYLQAQDHLLAYKRDAWYGIVEMYMHTYLYLNVVHLYMYIHVVDMSYKKKEEDQIPIPEVALHVQLPAVMELLPGLKELHHHTTYHQTSHLQQ